MFHGQLLVIEVSPGKSVSFRSAVLTLAACSYTKVSVICWLEGSPFVVELAVQIM